MHTSKLGVMATVWSSVVVPAPSGSGGSTSGGGGGGY
jgi:hypothetical protein